MALQPYSVTVPRGQEHLLPFPMKRRQAIGAGGGTSLTYAARLAFNKALEQYKPGGAYGKGVETALERGRTKAVAGGQQALVSAGLAGTSMMAAPGQRYEEEVAMPARAQVEETRAGRLAEIYAMLAEMEQRGFESMQERGSRTLMAPRHTGVSGYREPVSYGNSQVPNITEKIQSFTPNRISSAMQRVDSSPITFGEPFWGASEKWRSEQADWLKGAATWGQ